ncbi:2-oxoglutarate (2OG) and Fe(II)-dependent oxygenase superfamily protein [Wolffia australiana]
MGSMSGDILSSIGRVRLIDLVSPEGLPSDSYKSSVSTLAESFAQFSSAIIQLPANDGALLRSGLESSRLFFHQSAYPSSEMVHPGDPRDWCRTHGYYSNPQQWHETYDFRPGLTPTEPNGELGFPPVGLPDIFSLLGKASRAILDAISFSLSLRSFCFAEILDNVPLRSREVSSSVLSVCCHSRPSFHEAQHMAAQDRGQLVIFQDPELNHQVDKSLITVIKSDKCGLHVRDQHGQWVLVDGDLGPQEAVVYPGLTLYQATAGYVSPAVHRTEIDRLHGNIYGRCSISFKLMPKSMASLSCSEMRAAGHGVEDQFQIPILVDDFMQRPPPIDQRLFKHTFPNYVYVASQEGGGSQSLKVAAKREKNSGRCKPLPPSKRLRLEAQRVLRERVQSIADKKGIKLRFCSLKDCEGQHVRALDSPCGRVRMELGWPLSVPFVHPHDLPNKAKLGFLEAFEPGWTVAQHDMDLAFIEPRQQSG